MKKYKIANEGCDDSNWFDMELTEEELKVVIKIFEENNKHASYCCTPHLYVYKYGENKGEYSWEYTEDLRLNRDYDELNKKD